MNSPFFNLYQQLIARIKDQVPSIRYINQDIGQLENYNPSTSRPAVSYPCLLIDFDNFSVSDFSEGVQFLEGEITFRLILETYTNGSSLGEPAVREKALDYFDKEFALYKALNDWSADSIQTNDNKLIAHYGALSRIAVNTEKRDDGLRVRVIRFKASIEDYSAKISYDKLTVPVEITS